MHKRILTALVSLAALCGLVIPLNAAAQAVDLPDIPECTQLIPGAIALSSAPVTLDLRVLLDGVPQARAAQLVAAAQQAYSSQLLSFNASYETVSFSGTDAVGLVNQARDHYGGARPAGIDMVYVLTSKDIAAAPVGNAVAGLADCIGGVAFANRAFAVGENLADNPLNLVLFNAGTELAAKTLAHELGHLLGGHHHYANCVETLLNIGGNICTLMFNDLTFQQLQFSTLNSLVVRGHSQLFAIP
ncbi:MAG: zinc-dependent metalloprotease family protein [Nevskiales bacterium]